MYINKLFPFLSDGDFVRNVLERKSLDEIYCPIDFESSGFSTDEDMVRKNYTFKAYRVLPCDIYVLNEQESLIKRIMSGEFGRSVNLDVIEIDYMTIARNIEVEDGKASILMNGAYMQEDVVTDIFVNAASNGSKVIEDLMNSIKIEPKKGNVDMQTWMGSIPQSAIQESLADDLLAMAKKGKSISFVSETVDPIYRWLDSYFALPEGQDMKAGGREVVPLLIGPTGVFKSATIKELCKKYNYRLVDFRVAFTSRLDYSGLFQMGEIDGKKYSYACPMEEIVTCSDGFREYCRRAYDKISEILSRGYLEENIVSNGESTDSTQVPLNEAQKEELQKLLESYKEYMKTPVLFMDEITRNKDAGVEGVLVQLLNQKRFNNMTLNGCKFVAATNMNLQYPGDTRHEANMDGLNKMYDVNTEIDVAYSNRFMPLQVLPDDVKDRWFKWAESEKQLNGKTVSSIHPVILEFLRTPRGSRMVYDETPILDALEDGLTENEQRAQTFPNYRTWEMLSDYLYSIDEEFEHESKDKPDAKKLYRTKLIEGLISKHGADAFVPFLITKGYSEYSAVMGEPTDDVGDFLESTLDAGVPALMIGPSSLGKTSRVNAYRDRVEKRTGLRPEFININLAAKDAVDLMGMPSKVSLVDYVGRGKYLEGMGLGSVKGILQSVVSDVTAITEYGMTDTLTVRAPDRETKATFEKALREGREVILFFDECNRVKNTTVMSAMFECFTGETTVMLLDGRVLTMEELYSEAEKGNLDLWTYSVTEKGEIIPAHISCVIKKPASKPLMEIEMDDGSIICCTEDHKFMLRDGSYVMAKDLDDTMDIMEVEYRASTLDDMSRVEGYETVWTNARPVEEFTHQIVAKCCCGWKPSNGKVIHHKDYHKWNNNPGNLDCSMSYEEHIKFHGQHLQEVKQATDFEEKRLAGLRAYYADEERLRACIQKREARRVADVEREKERVEKISRTKKQRCSTDPEYRKRISKGLLSYNAGVASGEIKKDCSYVREYLREHPEHVKKFSDAGAIASREYWSHEENRLRRAEQQRERSKDPEYIAYLSGLLANRNQNEQMKKLQLLGKIRKVIMALMELEDITLDSITEDSYEVVRKSVCKNFPKYAKAMTLLEEVNLSFKDLVDNWEGIAV